MENKKLNKTDEIISKHKELMRSLNVSVAASIAMWEITKSLN